MFWHLLLAHFLADYPFQFTWIVRNKVRNGPMLLHVSIHFVMMVLVTAPASLKTWPFLLVIAAIHFFVDRGKINFGKRFPAQITGPYLIDQSIHFPVLALASYAIGRTLAGPLPMYMSVTAATIALGYVLVSYFWYISERIVTYANPEYQQEIIRSAIPRMLARAVYLTVFLLLFKWQVVMGALSGASILLPYGAPQFRSRALFTDMAVSAAVAALIELVTLSL